MSKAASVIHAKYYLFSVAGQRKYVSMISSANPYTGNTSLSWNNNHVIVADKMIYDSLNRYFHDMIKDKSNRKYHRTTTSGKYKIFLYPQTPKKPNDIVWMNALNQVTCKTTQGLRHQRRSDPDPGGQLGLVEPADRRGQEARPAARRRAATCR